MSNLAQILNPTNEDIIEDDNNCMVVISASDVPEVVSEIDQKVDDYNEVQTVLESLYSTHALIKSSLDSGNMIAAYSNAAKYEIHAARVASKLQIDRVSNYSTESLTMNELWSYQAEAGFFGTIKDKIVAFFKWVSAKISAIIKTIKGWFGKGGNDKNDKKEVDIKEAIQEVKDSPLSSFVLPMTGKMAYNSEGKPFAAAAAMKAEYSTLSELLHGYHEFTKDITKFVANIDHSKNESMEAMDKKIRELVTSRSNALHSKKAFCFEFKVVARGNQLEKLSLVNADRASDDREKYYLEIKKNDLLECLEESLVLFKKCSELADDLGELNIKFAALEKSISAAGEADGQVMYLKAKESMSVVGKLIGGLLQVTATLHSGSISSVKIKNNESDKKEEK